MKMMKKVMALILSLLVVMSMAVPVVGAESTGTITVEGAVDGQTYNLYKIFDLEYVKDGTDNSHEAFKYTLSSNFAGLDTYSYTKDSTTVSASSYFKVVEPDNHIEWVGTSNESRAAEFSALIKSFLDSKKDTLKISPDKTVKKEAGKDVAFDDLPYGYYYLDTTLGALLSLDTLNDGKGTIKEKNGEPIIEKKVKEGDNWQDYNDASVGDDVKFKTTITVVDGNPENYVMHDSMSEGLTYKSVDSVKIGEKDISTNVTADGTAYYTLETNNLTEHGTDSSKFTCDFEIQFFNLKPNDVITVEYTATLNANAVVGSDGNPNDVYLEYDNKEFSKWKRDDTKTYTWEFDVYKYTESGTAPNTTEIPLAGAEFVLTTSETAPTKQEGATDYSYTGGTDKVIKFVANTAGDTKVGDDVTTVCYKVATDSASSATASITTTECGKINLEGLDAGTYYLHEVKAPTGYNQIPAPIKVEISSEKQADETIKAIVKYSMKENDNWGTAQNIDDTHPNVKVLNNTGSALPETGGIGTTIFYVVGGIMMVVAIVLLVTKKKMSKK